MREIKKMNDNNNLKEFTKYKFGSKELQEEVKPKEFLINGLPLIRFEDKKPYSVEVDRDEEILSKETDYGLKFYLKVKIENNPYYWQMSKTTLRKIEQNQKINIFNVMLDKANKNYSIIPLNNN